MITALLRSSSLLVALTTLASPTFAAVKEDVVKNYAQVPLHFEANRGQTRDDVKFLARGPGYGVYLTANDALLALSPSEQSVDGSARGNCTADSATSRSRVLRMSLVGGAKTPAVSGLDEQRGKANYFVGSDASQWRTNIPTYAKVRYDEVYPGIDVVYYGTQRQLEYDFVLAPGADPKDIELEFNGADRVEIDANGDLVLHACGREIRQPKPILYQEAHGRREVAGAYVRTGKNRISFAVAAYDRNLPLVIDPIVLSYATYLGGHGGFDEARGVAVDAHGAAYVAGTTGAPDFPVSAGAYQTTFGGGGGAGTAPADAFVTKFNADGRVAYSSYIGGFDNDHAWGIAVDHDGNAYVVGETDSAFGFPTTSGAFQEASSFGRDAYGLPFVVKLDPTGSALIYSTLVGGAGGYSSGNGIAVDASGSAYITGQTSAPDFPTTPDAFQQPFGPFSSTQTFIVKLDTSGSTLVYASRFGPPDAAGNPNTIGSGIALGDDGSAYVVGTTNSAAYPVTSGAFQTTRRGYADAVVTKLGTVGELVYSTYLGGEAGQGQYGASEGGNAIAVDAGGNAYVTGNTTATDFPTTPGAYRTTLGASPTLLGRGFVTKVNPTGSGLVYSTLLSLPGVGIAVDALGRAYVAGGEDAFVTVIDASGTSASVSGVSAGTTGQGDTGIALDSAGKNVWVVGYTNGYDFPATPNARQSHLAGGTDAFVAKFATDARSVPGTFEAEDFDQGGEGPGYHELTPGNQGDAGYRTGEDVDIFVSNDPAGGGRIVKNFQSGEWLAYTINVTTGLATSGPFDVELRASTHPAFPGSSYYVQVDGINVTGTVTLPDTGGWDNYQWLGKRTISLTAGQHVLRVVAVTPYFNLNSIRLTSTVTSSPFFGSPTAVPGEFEAEAFDRGGEGVASHDNSRGNQGDSGVRIGEDVDIFVTNDAATGSSYVVKNFEAGEWLAYTISVPANGNYDVDLRISSQADFPDRAYHLEVDGTNATGAVVLPDTGGWDNYQWAGRQTVALTAGTHVLKLVVERPYFNLNSIRVTTAGSTGPAAHAVPGQIEAEDFDIGGEGPGYHENTPGNQGDTAFRASEDVDIFTSHDSGSGSWYIVKNFEAGEWLAYSISVPTSGNYDVELRAATSFDFPNASFYVQVDGINVSGIVTLPDTGGWDSYQWIGKSTISLTAGSHSLRIVAYQPYFNFNALRIVHSP